MKKGFSLILSFFILFVISGCARSGQYGSTDPAASNVFDPSPEATSPTATSSSHTVYITFFREGIESTIPVTVVSGSSGNYQIATNPELFRQEAGDSSDVFRYTLWEGQPNIYYSVTYHPDVTAEFLADGLLHQNSGATSERVKIGQYDAIAVYTSKSDPFMSQQHFYLIAHGTGCYMIETQFVIEMYEGLFPQMRALFDTFQILD